MAKAAHLESTFETLIADHLTDNGWKLGHSNGYSPQLGFDPEEFGQFLKTTQSSAWASLVGYYGGEVAAATKIGKRLSDELTARGVIDVLRKGIKDSGIRIHVAYFEPAHDLTPEQRDLYLQNRLTVVRQAHISGSSPLDSVDLLFMLNGIPTATLELKSQTSGQSVENAVAQYRYDRTPSDLIFRHRVVVNFAVDEDNVYTTTKLSGASTEFRPFNMGSNGPGSDGGKGNPLNPVGPRSAYLWERVLQKDAWMELLGSFIHVAYLRDENTGKLSGEKLIVFPRFHQWHAVRELLNAAVQHGPGNNKLCQHSAGSGKSNTISWLAHRLSVLHAPAHLDPSSALSKSGVAENQLLFDKVIVVTDRRILDKQLRDTVASFDHEPGSIVTIEEGKGSKNEQLRQALESKAARIVITTLQTFPVLARATTELAGTRFAVIADEAHSSQTGEASKDLKSVLAGGNKVRDEEDVSGEVPTFSDLLEQSVSERGPSANVSFFGFTATPKTKTLELFGEKVTRTGEDPVFVPFHLYSMKQAIEERYILDVLAFYTTYKTYYRLANGLGGDDIELPKGKAGSALARFASLHPANLGQKAEIIVEHFRANTAKKIGGRAKAMVVTRSRLHAVRYKRAIDSYIASKAYKDIRTLVAFSGTVYDPDLPGSEDSEASMNGFASMKIPDQFAKSYQVLVVAEKYQTGFDQPLLHTMYVDKKLDGVAAVQTLSRLNRTEKGKDDTFVLDFANDAEDIQAAFRPFFQETSATPSDPNLLYNLQTRIMAAGVISGTEMSAAVEGILRGGTTGNALLKANTDPAVARWDGLEAELDRDEFRAACTDFSRAYSFLAQIITFKEPELEELYYYVKYLVTRLPNADSSGAVDLDGSVILTHIRTNLIADAENLSLHEGSDEPGSTFSQNGRGGAADDPMALLSELIDKINERFGLNLTDADRIWFDQQMEHMSANEDIRAVAEANDFDNFEIYLTPVIEGEIIERHEANEELFSAFFNKPEFQDLVTETIARALYKKFGGEISSPKS